MSDESPWERVARESLWRALHCARDDLEATVESVGSTVYFDRDLDPEQVERLRQGVADLEHVTEEYVARLCDGAEPWTDEDDRNPSWQPLDEPGDSE